MRKKEALLVSGFYLTNHALKRYIERSGKKYETLEDIKKDIEKILAEAVPTGCDNDAYIWENNEWIVPIDHLNSTIKTFVLKNKGPK